MARAKKKRVCVYEYVQQALGRILVSDVMAHCNLSKLEAITILEELKSKRYVGGNATVGYWFVRTYTGSYRHPYQQ
jgi:hypothetical protein